MSEPRQAWIILEEISGRILAGNDAADTFYGLFDTAMTAIASSLSAITTNTNDIKEGVYGLYSLDESNHADLMTLLNDMNGRVDGINAALDTLSTNTSLNAQVGQQLLLGTVGACCDVISIDTFLPDDMCQKAQSMIDIMEAIIERVMAETDGIVPPTAASILEAFTVISPSGVITQLITLSEANAILSALLTFGISRLDDLLLGAESTEWHDAAKAILGVATNASQATFTLKLIDAGTVGIEPDVLSALVALFPVGLVNSLWADPPIWDTTGYTDDCGGTEPEEGSGWRTINFLINQTGDDTVGTIGASIDLADAGSDHINPAPYGNTGAVLKVRWCGNNTTNADKAIQLGTVDNDPESSFVSIEEGSDTFFYVPAQRFIHAFAYGRNPGDGTGLASIVIAWQDADLAHCPE